MLLNLNLSSFVEATGEYLVLMFMARMGDMSLRHLTGIINVVYENGKVEDDGSFRNG